jgi:dihydroorotase
VKSLGDAVACTITAHHLALTVDDWAGQAFNFCKPVAKYPDDREALREVVREGKYSMFFSPCHQNLSKRFCSGHPRFFLGSDSAPHPLSRKSTCTPSQGCAAGVYTAPILLPLVAHLLESFGALNQLEDFVSSHGRRFYGFEVKGTSSDEKIAIFRSRMKVQETMSLHGETVVPFWAGKELNWSLVASTSKDSV